MLEVKVESAEEWGQRQAATAPPWSEATWRAMCAILRGAPRSGRNIDRFESGRGHDGQSSKDGPQWVGGTMKVEVFHNIARDGHGRSPGMLDGFQPTHPVLRVFAAELDDPYDDLVACNTLYTLLNVGHDPEFTNPPDVRALEYRFRQNRSLSKGDLIRLDGRRWYAVESVGWRQVTSSPRVVTKTSVPGSTELPAEDGA